MTFIYFHQHSTVSDGPNEGVSFKLLMLMLGRDMTESIKSGECTGVDILGAGRKVRWMMMGAISGS